MWDHLNFAYMTQLLTGGIIVDKLENEFKVLFAFREACTHLQSFSYQENFELRILVKEIITLEFLTLEQSKILEIFSSTMYLLNAPPGGGLSQTESASGH